MVFPVAPYAERCCAAGEYFASRAETYGPDISLAPGFVRSEERQKPASIEDFDLSCAGEWRVGFSHYRPAGSIGQHADRVLERMLNGTESVFRRIENRQVSRRSPDHDPAVGQHPESLRKNSPCGLAAGKRVGEPFSVVEANQGMCRQKPNAALRVFGDCIHDIVEHGCIRWRLPKRRHVMGKSLGTVNPESSLSL